MNSKLLLIAGLLLALVLPRVNTGEDVVKMMYKKYSGKWERTLVFDQTTEIYRDTTKRVQTWYESMLFPDRLRIDIEPTSAGNSIIFRGDSTYNIANGKIRAASGQGNDLVFLLGGLYFYPLQQSLDKLKGMGYDLAKVSESTFNGKAIYVIGTLNSNDKTNQLWVNKDDLYLVRMIKYDKGTKQDAIFEDYIKLGGGGAETKVTFYLNDKLRQVETYHHCKTEPHMDASIFDPQHYRVIDHKN